MLFRYKISHHPDAVSQLEQAMHRKSDEQIEDEYQNFDFPFRYYFENMRRVSANWERASDGAIIVSIEIQDGTQNEADTFLSDFLVNFNKRRPGIAFVLDARLASN